MIKAIWKFEILPAHATFTAMPKGAKLLHVSTQATMAVLHVWAEVDTEAEMVMRQFSIRGTGHPLDDEEGEYVGSVVSATVVWHVYDRGEDPA